MKYFVLGGERTTPTDVANRLLTCDFAFLYLEGEFSRDAMADMLVAGSKPVVIADACASPDVSTTLAKFTSRAHYLGHPESEQQALRVAVGVVEHACGERVCIAFISEIAQCLEAAESPIEARLALHLCMALDCEARVTAQSPIAIDGKTYRADFLIESSDSDLRVVVEADGHDFHERTKEQASRDKSRDRAMLAAGYQVMRFTGSEIWKDPSRCADEVRSVFSRDR